MKRIPTFKEFLNEGQMSDAVRWNPAKHKEFHEAKKELLKEISNCLSGCKWWIDYGTLLGAVRDGDFIKADNDTDIGIIAKHLTPELIDKINANPKLTIDGNGDHDRWFKTVVKLKDDEGKNVSINGKGIFCDIYVYYPLEDFHVMCDSDKYYRIENSYTSKLVNVTIHGMRVPAPTKSKEYLEGIYGEEWETPNKGKTQHYNMITQFMNKLKSYKYDRKNNKGVVEYTKKHLEELKNEEKDDKK